MYSDAIGLSNAIRGLLEDRDRALQLADRGYATAVERFGLKAFLANIEAARNEVALSSRSVSVVDQAQITDSIGVPSHMTGYGSLLPQGKANSTSGLPRHSPAMSRLHVKAG